MTAEPWSPALWDELEKHVFSSLDREVGGILVGTVTDGTASVTAVLPALAATSGSANVTFTHEVWEHVHATLDRDYPDDRIVGWYHSHPGFGVFLSDYDTFAHRSFFDDPALLAVVVDPHAGEAGWFALRDGELVRVGSRATVRAGTALAAAASPTAGRRRVALATAGGLALAAGVAGFFAGSLTSPGHAVVRTVRVAATPTPSPSPSPPQAQPTTAPVGSLTYRVRRGDSFWQLAQAFYGDPLRWQELKAANPQHPGTALDVNEQLRVPVTLKAR